jgi:hypothetical protein
MSDYDSPWKEALDLYFESFVAWALPTVHGEIDWSLGYEMLDKELQQAMPEAEVGRRYVDALAKVRLRSGKEEWLLVHVEVQTQDSAEFARRMFVYHCRLRERYDRDVLSVAILADDQPNWRPSEYDYDCLNLCRLTFRFPIVKLLDSADAEPAIGPGANPFQTIVKAHLETLATRKSFDDRRVRKTELVKRLFLSGLDAEAVRKLFRLIDWLMDLPRQQDRTFWSDLKTFREERKVPFKTTFERYEREEAVAEGLAKGRAQALAQTITKQLDRRFGVDAVETIGDVNRLAEFEALDRILDAVLAGETLESIRARIREESSK